MTTIQYMPPEVVLVIWRGYRVTGNWTQIEYLNKICQNHSIDVWSLGISILELIMGIPIYLQKNIKVQLKNGNFIEKGSPLSMKELDYEGLIKKQKKLCENLELFLEPYLLFMRETERK